MFVAKMILYKPSGKDLDINSVLYFAREISVLDKALTKLNKIPIRNSFPTRRIFAVHAVLASNETHAFKYHFKPSNLSAL